MFNFKDKTIKEIRTWAWAAAVLPISALAGIFFIWSIGLSSVFETLMVVGATAMFSIAVIWWWWSMMVFRNLTNLLRDTELDLVWVLKSIKEIKESFRSHFKPKKDK